MTVSTSVPSEPKSERNGHYDVNKDKDSHYNNNNNNCSTDHCEKSRPSSENSNGKVRSALAQALAVSAKNMLLFCYGTTLGLPTIAIPYLSSEDHRLEDPYLALTRSQVSWFSSINLIMVPLGCMISGRVTQPVGRKRSMMFLNLPFILAFLLYHNATHVAQLYLALAICGFFGGVLEAPVLTYVAEITEPHLRGMLSATASMATIFGTVSQLFLGSFVHWRTAAILNLMFPIMALIVLYFIPESPHWLISKGRIPEASASLAWLRGWVTPDVVQPELSQITKAIEDSALKRLGKDGLKRPNYRMYLRRSFLMPYSLVTALFFIGQFGGMTALQSYAVGIFEHIQAPVDPYLATLLLGLAELSGALLCVLLVHHTGKRPLALISTAGSALCFLLVALYVQYHLTQGWDSPLVPTVLLLLAAFLTHICIRLLPWMLIGEVFPNNIRATASGMSGSSSYVFAFAVNKLYYPMVDTFNLSGTLYFYSAISLLGTLYMYKMMPETEGRTLSDIEEHFADKSKTFVTNIEKKKKNKERMSGMEKGDELVINREKEEESVRENRDDVEKRIEKENQVGRMIKQGVGKPQRMETEDERSDERRQVSTEKKVLSGCEPIQDGMKDHLRSIESREENIRHLVSSKDVRGMNADQDAGTDAVNSIGKEVNESVTDSKQHHMGVRDKSCKENDEVLDRIGGEKEERRKETDDFEGETDKMKERSKEGRDNLALEMEDEKCVSRF
uniref:Facilitated trehalose transporter Tret1 n=1 Tax=Cacopsylla melanoneura TaxID=428564 RepID=A0A8D9B8Y3_9HEMI